MFTYIFLYLYIYIFLIIEYISPALKLGRGIYFYNKKNILRLTGTCRASIQIIFILWEAGGWCTSLPNIIFLYAELKERIMPKSYYRHYKNSSFVNGYNEMRIRKRQVHCWPFLTGILIYWPAKRREHLHVWHTKETDHPGETQAEITRPSSTGSTDFPVYSSHIIIFF